MAEKFMVYINQEATQKLWEMADAEGKGRNVIVEILVALAALGRIKFPKRKHTKCKRTQLQVRVPEEVAVVLKEASEKTGWKISQILEELIINAHSVGLDKFVILSWEGVFKEDERKDRARTTRKAKAESKRGSGSSGEDLLV